MRLILNREIEVPDPVKLSRYARMPELGPKILFFSGGSALRSLSRKLIGYTHNSIHLITPFDSGGSSAVLREAFQMLGIGDLRARLIDLADQSLQGNPEVYTLFSHRLAPDGEPGELAVELESMVSGNHRLLQNIPDPMRKIIRNHLYRFRQEMPDGFDLRRASIGNLILAAGFIENRRHPDPAIYILSKLLQARGIVRPIYNSFLHLAALLDDGSTVVGQHRLTGKEVAPLRHKIRDLFLVADEQDLRPEYIAIRPKVMELIAAAELICYPMGSFYTSVIANLLPSGVGRAIAANRSPKIYIPNTTMDPECIGMELTEQVQRLVEFGCRDGVDITPADIVNFVVIDSRGGSYQGYIDHEKLRKQGIEVIDCRLISERSAPLIDEDLLLPILLSLA
jgi:CofD-related protein of GAK system